MTSPKERSWVVFLCYRRTDGGEAAAELFQVLNGRRVLSSDGEEVQLDVYYDQVQAGVANWKEHHLPALQRARSLIVVSSPGIAADLSQPGQPDWVHRELKWWIQNRPVAPIFVDVTGEGTRYWPPYFPKAWANVNRLPLDPARIQALSESEREATRARLFDQISGGIRDRETKIAYEEIEHLRRLNRRLRLLVGTALVLLLSVGFLAWRLADALRTRSAALQTAKTRLGQAQDASREVGLALVELLSVPGTEEIQRRLLKRFDHLADTLQEKGTEDERTLALQMQRHIITMNGVPEGEARRQIEAAVRIARELTQRDPENSNWRYGLWLSVDLLSRFDRESDPDAASQYLEEALEIARVLLRGDTASELFAGALLKTLAESATFADKRARWTEVLALRRERLALAERLATEHPRNRKYRLERSIELEKLGKLEWAHGTKAAAKEFFERDLDSTRELVDLDHKNALYRRALARSLSNLGFFQFEARQWAPALELFSGAMDALWMSNEVGRDGERRYEIVQRLAQCKLHVGDRDGAMALVDLEINQREALMKGQVEGGFNAEFRLSQLRFLRDHIAGQ